MSYKVTEKTPDLGTQWVWEVDKAHARCLVEVVEVHWNGEEWWVWTKTLLPDPGLTQIVGNGIYGNDLSRFREAVQSVGCKRGVWVQRTGKPGVPATWGSRSLEGRPFGETTAGSWSRPGGHTIHQL